MRDPFADLRATTAPVDPDPDFAARLRARLERALALPRGVVPVTTPTESHAAARYRHGDVGHVSLNIPDAARATEFYAAVLGWTYTDFERPRVEGATPSTGIWESDEPSTVFCAYAVDDVREAVRRVREAGGSAGEPERQPWGLTADCTDDQGTTFALFEQPDDLIGDRPPANGRRAGDPSYLTVEVVDSARARAFYGAVLGWRFAPGTIADGWQVEDTVPMIGLAGGRARATIVPMWKVADVATATDAVRAGGGTATDPERQPYGTTSECTDDQGMRFYLGDA